MFLSRNIILPSCDHTLLKVCSSLAFSNILILVAVKLSVTLIPVPFNFFLFLYIPLRVLCLTNFTIIGRGLAFFEDLGLPSLRDLSISSGLIVSYMLCCSLLMIFSSFPQLSPPLFPVLKGNYALNIALVYLLQHSSRQAYYLSSYYFLKTFNLLIFFLQGFFKIFELFIDKTDGFVHIIKRLSSCNLPVLSSKRYFLYTLHFYF